MERVLTMYVGSINADPNEGRGPMRDYGYYVDPMDAYNRVKGEGVMGVGDGNVIERIFWLDKTTMEYKIVDEIVYYGSRWGMPNTFAQDHWRPDLSPAGNDPEWAEYVRLRDKFEKE